MGSAAGETWTREIVEARLIATFRKMPSCPVFSVGSSRMRTASGDRRTEMTDVLEWADLLRDDPDGRLQLWTWARCQATGSSFTEVCSAWPWSRATVERGRRRAAVALAAALNRRALQPRGEMSDQVALDSEKTGVVISERLTELCAP